MENSTQNAPEHIAAGLYRFGFQPDNGRRKSFSQWRLDVGKPIEVYADVYVEGSLVELYQKPRNGKHLMMRFSGRVESQLDLIRLLWQCDFIQEAEYWRAVRDLAPQLLLAPAPLVYSYPEPYSATDSKDEQPRRVCVGSAGGEVIKTEWPAGFKQNNSQEEPPF